MNNEKKIYPTESELSLINKELTCPECCNIFKSQTNLNLHLAKTHNQSHLLQTDKTPKIFYCPIITCCYNTKSHFKQLKLLKQHYLKVHSKKSFECYLCMKGFPTEACRDRHSEYCDIRFKCCDCDMVYGSYETLKTHSRRKKHKILEKVAYKFHGQNLPAVEVGSEIIKSQRLLLPKLPAVNVIIIPDTIEQSSQTEKPNILQISQETQTIVAETTKFTTETQTSYEYLNENRSIKTQTCTVSPPRTVSCNTSFNLTGFDLEMNEVQRSSSGTQTTLNDWYLSSNTDASNILADSMDSNDFMGNNMETQTGSMFSDELFKCSTETQTCAVSLPRTVSCNTSFNLTGFGLEMNEVQRSSSGTQTSLNDWNLSSNTQASNMLADSMNSNFFIGNNMETQTDSMCGDELFKCSIDTQTSHKYLNENRSIKTQTCAVSPPRTVSCNTSFNLTGFDLEMNEVQRSSSETQTTLNDSYLSSNTDASDMLADSMDFNYFMGNNMETQTDSMFNDELFKCCDDYTNMYTQTCAELLDDIELNHSETQTVLEAVLKSVESQTVLSQSKRVPLSCKDLTHMETQTDTQYKYLNKLMHNF